MQVSSPLPAPPQPPHPRLEAVCRCQEPLGGDEGCPTVQTCLLEQNHLPGLGMRRTLVPLDDPGLSPYMPWRGWGQKRGLRHERTPRREGGGWCLGPPTPGVPLGCTVWTGRALNDWPISHCPELFALPPHSSASALAPPRGTFLGLFPFSYLKGRHLLQPRTSRASFWLTDPLGCPLWAGGRERFEREAPALPSPSPSVPVTRASMMNGRIVMAWRGGRRAGPRCFWKQGGGRMGRLRAGSCPFLSPSPALTVPREKGSPGLCPHSTPISGP